MQTPGLQEAIASNEFWRYVIVGGGTLLATAAGIVLKGWLESHKLKIADKLEREKEDRALLREANEKRAGQKQLRANQCYHRLLKFQEVTKKRIREEGKVMQAGGGENAFDEDWQEALDEIRRDEPNTKLIAELQELLQKRETLNLVHPLLPWLVKRIREAQDLDAVEEPFVGDSSSRRGS